MSWFFKLLGVDRWIRQRLLYIPQLTIDAISAKVNVPAVTLRSINVMLVDYLLGDFKI